MGFWPNVRIVKQRRSAHVQGMEICLDQVDGLGAFLELERMVDDDTSGDTVQDELVAYVAGLGIDAERRRGPAPQWRRRNGSGGAIG